MKNKTSILDVLLIAATGLILFWVVLSRGLCFHSGGPLLSCIVVFISAGILLILGILGHAEQINVRDLILIGLATIVLVLVGREFNAGIPDGGFALIYLLLTCLVAATK